MHSGGSNLHGVIFFNWCVLLQVFIPSVKVLEGGWRGSLRRRFWFFQAVRAVLWEGVCQHLLDPKWNWISAIEEQACDAAKFWATIGSRLLFSSTLSLPLLFFFSVFFSDCCRRGAVRCVRAPTWMFFCSQHRLPGWQLVLFSIRALWWCRNTLLFLRMRQRVVGGGE